MVKTRKKASKKEADFKKRKVKVGRVLSKASASRYENKVDTTVAAKRIKLSEQDIHENNLNSAATILKNLPLTEHHNKIVRKQALLEIKSCLEECITPPFNLMSRIVDRLRVRINDEEKIVREEAVLLTKCLFSQKDKDHESLSYFMNIILLHAVSNLSQTSLSTKLHGAEICNFLVTLFPVKIISDSNVLNQILEGYSNLLRELPGKKNAKWFHIAQATNLLMKEIKKKYEGTSTRKKKKALLRVLSQLEEPEISGEDEEKLVKEEILGQILKSCSTCIDVLLPNLQTGRGQSVKKANEKKRGVLKQLKNKQKKKKGNSAESNMTLPCIHKAICLTKTILENGILNSKDNQTVVSCISYLISFFPLKSSVVSFIDDQLVESNLSMASIMSETDLSVETARNILAYMFEFLNRSNRKGVFKKSCVENMLQVLNKLSVQRNLEKDRVLDGFFTNLLDFYSKLPMQTICQDSNNILLSHVLRTGSSNISEPRTNFLNMLCQKIEQAVNSGSEKLQDSIKVAFILLKITLRLNQFQENESLLLLKTLRCIFFKEDLNSVELDELLLSVFTTCAYTPKLCSSEDSRRIFTAEVFLTLSSLLGRKDSSPYFKEIFVCALNLDLLPLEDKVKFLEELRRKLDPKKFKNLILYLPEKLELMYKEYIKQEGAAT
eukprot:augustus_masked-scaffold_12-processed-gene-12.92-mRNA-1 protein AED:1.00 eAED:1.00 QI:0/-1/0/0/-1/1/1/0/665